MASFDRNISKKVWFQSSLSELSWKFWSFVVRRPSVSFSYFHLFLQNHWADFNQLGTKHPWVIGILIYSKRVLSFSVEMTNWRKYIDEVLKRSSLEPLGQFQPNLAESILGCFQGEIIINNVITKIHWRNLKILFSRTTGLISTKHP